VWVRLCTSPTDVWLAARVPTSTCRLDESACWVRLRANVLAELASYELPDTLPPSEKKPTSIPSPPPPLTDDSWNSEVVDAFSLTLMLLTAFAIPAM
jgi:hypothetical protein